jgi:hypothetical protein
MRKSRRKPAFFVQVDSWPITMGRMPSGLRAGGVAPEKFPLRLHVLLNSSCSRRTGTQ